MFAACVVVIALSLGLCSRALAPQAAYTGYTVFEPLQCANSSVGIQFWLGAPCGVLHIFELLGVCNREMVHAGSAPSRLDR